jgi:Flp pilus assembly protein TadD
MPHANAEQFSGSNGIASKIIFLPVPENLKSKTGMSGFSINPDIPIPIELPAAFEKDKPDFAVLEHLSIEMIAAGMIRVICGRGKTNTIDNATAAYYRNFVTAFKPDILKEFKNAAIIHLQKGSYGTAHEIITALDGLFPGLAEVAELNSMLFEERAARDSPDYKDAYRLISGGNEENGMEKLRKFLELYPNSWNGWFMLGWALRRLKRWKEAAACFHKAIDSGGTCADAYNELAICLIETGDYGQAKNALNTALSHEPKSIKIMSNLAILALKTGHEVEAEALFREILELDPNDPVATEFFS